MKTINVVNGPQNVSSVILGCMRMPAASREDAGDRRDHEPGPPLRYQ